MIYWNKFREKKSILLFKLKENSKLKNFPRKYNEYEKEM